MILYRDNHRGVDIKRVEYSGVVDNLLHKVCKVFLVPGRDKETVATFLDEFRHTAEVTCDDRNSCKNGFLDNEGRYLEPFGWDYQDVYLFQDIVDVIGVIRAFDTKTRVSRIQIFGIFSRIPIDS